MDTGEKAQLVERLPCEHKEQGAGRILSTDGRSQQNQSETFLEAPKL